jgi:hypothetical protein
MTPPPLKWVGELHASFNRAAECSPTYLVKDTVNPLIKEVIFFLSEPLGGKSYQPFQTLAHGFAKANDCIIERIYNHPQKLILVVVMKRRLGPDREKNPLAGDKRGSFKRG